MAQTDSARMALRAATAPHHDRVDRLFSAIDLGDRGSYARFLVAQAGAHIPVEAALTRAGAAAVLPDWPERQRAAALRADLAELGCAAPAGGAVPAFADAAAVLGGVYVLEGSRLGGRMLLRQLAPGLPHRFLGAGDSGAWRRLLATLDTMLASDAARASAIRAAAAVFAAFEDAGRQALATPDG